MSATGYDVYVQADCGGGDVSPWSAAVSFATQVACGDNVGPICYGPGNTQVFTAQVSNPGDFITVTVSQGNTEAGYDTVGDLSDDILDFTERNPFGEIDE